MAKDRGFLPILMKLPPLPPQKIVRAPEPEESDLLFEAQRSIRLAKRIIRYIDLRDWLPEEAAAVKESLSQAAAAFKEAADIFTAAQGDIGSVSVNDV